MKYCIYTNHGPGHIFNKFGRDELLKLKPELEFHIYPYSLSDETYYATEIERFDPVLIELVEKHGRDIFINKKVSKTPSFREEIQKPVIDFKIKI